MPNFLIVEFIRDFIHESELQQLFERYLASDKLSYMFTLGRKLTISVGNLDKEAQIELAMEVTGYLLNNFDSKISVELTS